MERKLLERLTGAVVLVLVLVVVAPLTLNGVYEGTPEREPAAVSPADTDTRIFFPNSEGAPRTAAVSKPAEPAVSDPEQSSALETTPVISAQPEPVAEEPAEEKPAPTVKQEEPAKPAVAETSPAPKPVSKPAPGPQPTAGQWQVQLGSFSQRENAENLAGNVRKGGFSATVTGYQRDGRSMYRVRSGPFSSRAEADARIRELASIGYRGIVVSPGEG